ncbi:hypothetical protein B0H13DRAFT_1890902 [Mycena leptocephala]|nr:hypothetical protein B0H13DRAFT_1890902 [Mycena leptocephala]
MSADDEVYRTEAEQGRDEEIASDDSDMEMVVDGEEIRKLARHGVTKPAMLQGREKPRPSRRWVRSPLRRSPRCKAHLLICINIDNSEPDTAPEICARHRRSGKLPAGTHGINRSLSKWLLSCAISPYILGLFVLLFCIFSILGISLCSSPCSGGMTKVVEVEVTSTPTKHTSTSTDMASHLPPRAPAVPTLRWPYWLFPGCSYNIHINAKNV